MPGTKRQRGVFATTRAGSFKKRRRVTRRPVTKAGFLGIETKFFDTEATNDAFTTTWATMEPATTNLTAIAQGDGESNRDGRLYAIKSIHIKGFVTTAIVESSSTPLGDEAVRFCLVHDTQTNGAQLTATDVMDGGGGVDILAFRNLAFTKRFKVLFDETLNIKQARAVMSEGGVNLFATGISREMFKINKIFNPPIMVTMSDTGADIANVTDNSIHMIGVGRTGNGLLTYQCRVRFVG